MICIKFDISFQADIFWLMMQEWYYTCEFMKVDALDTVRMLISTFPDIYANKTLNELSYLLMGDGGVISRIELLREHHGLKIQSKSCIYKS